MRIKVRYSGVRDKYLVSLINELGAPQWKRWYSTSAGALRAIVRLQAEGHTIEESDFNLIALP